MLQETVAGCSDQDESMLKQLSPKPDNGDKKGEYADTPLSLKMRSFASKDGEPGVKDPPLVKHESVGLSEDSLPVSSGHSISKKYSFKS